MVVSTVLRTVRYSTESSRHLGFGHGCVGADDLRFVCMRVYVPSSVVDGCCFWFQYVWNYCSDAQILERSWNGVEEVLGMSWKRLAAVRGETVAQVVEGVV